MVKIEEEIAIVSMSVRAPGVDDLSDFEKGIVTHASASRHVPSGRWFDQPSKLRDLSTGVMGHFIPDVGSFDMNAFGFSREQALRLDPQQRLVLETGRLSLEGAGLLARHASRDVGVFVGARMNTYGYTDAVASGTSDPALASPALWGRSQNFLAAWLSDRFDLTGPAMVIDTACSSSLVALWAAMAALRAGECTAALVGGVDLLLDPLTIPLLAGAGALSPEGECRTFDRRANGYVPGEGAGTIVLKPLSRARRDRDEILATLVNVTTNNDGRTMGVTTPNPRAQVDLLRRAYEGLDPSRLGFVEAHGTGTLIGDPIEVKALAEAFSEYLLPPGSVTLHSLKRSIGHLHSAAGIVGLIHTVVHLQAGRRPEMEKLDLNPRLQLADTPLTVERPGPETAAGTTWDTAGVSAFGFGGTNAHAVLSRAPHSEDRSPSEEWTGALLLSAPTSYQLRELAAQWLEALGGASPMQARAMVDAQRDRAGTYDHRCGVSGSIDVILARLRAVLLTDELEELDDVKRIRFGTTVSPNAAWLSQIRVLSERVDADLTAVEKAASARLGEMPNNLLAPVLALAVAGFLADQAIPPEAFDFGPEEEVVRGYAWGRLSIQAALPAFMRRSSKEQLTPSGGAETVLGRLEAGLDAQTIAAELAVSAFLAGYAVARVRPAVLPEARRLPNWQYTGVHLSLPLASRTSDARSRAVDDADPSRGGRGTGSFSREFGPSDVPIMLHEVFHTPMLPGVGWLSFISDAVGGLTNRSIENLTFQAPLRPDGTTTVTMETKSDGTFIIASEDGQGFARGELRPSASPPEGIAGALDGLADEKGHLASGTSVYRWLRRLGYYHGRYYRNISWVLSTQTGTIARIEGERQKDVDPDGSPLPIGLLDSVTIAAVEPGGEAFGNDDADVVVPLSIGKVQCWGSIREASYVVSLRKHAGTETQRFDQYILDRGGRVLMGLIDITSKKVPKGAFDASGERPNESDVGPDEQRTTGDAVSPPTSERLAGGSFMDRVGAALGVAPEDFDNELLTIGMGSADLVDASARIGEALGVDLYPTVLFEYPTVASFAQYLLDQGVSHSAEPRDPSDPNDETSRGTTGQLPSLGPQPEESKDGEGLPSHSETPSASEKRAADAAVSGRSNSHTVSVIGASIRVPGADGLEGFWSLLEQGFVSISDPPNVPVRETKALDRGSYLQGIDLFDPEPFRISPREAPMIDVQARILYETVLHAIEDAGGTGTKRVGLWVGYGHDHYAEEKIRAGVSSGRGLGLPAMVANRLSHVMDWQGPSRVVSTLCSSGLVALHDARHALIEEECDIAVVASAQAGLTGSYFASMKELGALSGSGRSRPFDDEADGFVPGEGAVAVVLQRSDLASEQLRRSRATVLGSAVNHNGRASRYSAPSSTGQGEVILQALKMARIDPRTIGLLEAHGTGTELGDPIEIEGLTRAWRSFTRERQFCSIGSVKSNIGHLEPAAGLAGLVKVIMSMQKGMIPPTAGLRRPNERTRFHDTPFFLTDRLRDWPRHEGLRRGAVSAFGLGGANAHVIVEEPHDEGPEEPTSRSESSVVRFTASGAAALRELVVATKEEVAKDPSLIHDLGATLTRGRESQRLRLVCAGSSSEIARQMDEFLEDGTRCHRKPASDAHLTFVYPGQGSQVPGMGLQLMRESSDFQEAVGLLDHEGSSLGLPPISSVWGMHKNELAETENSQMALVGFQASITLMLREWGIRPSAVIGHSVGELTALWASDAFDLRTLIELVLRRSTLMKNAPRGGAMAAVWAGREETKRYLSEIPDLDLAAFNSPSLTTVSGPEEAVRELRSRPGLRVHELKVSHAFHSRAMKEAGRRFQSVAEELLTIDGVRSPRVACAATSRPGWHDRSTVTDANGWRESLSGPVDFAGAVELVGSSGGHVFVEISPRPTLITAGQETLPDATWLPLAASDSRTPHGATEVDLHALVRELAPYVEPNWSRIPPTSRLADAPLYPFQRESFWVRKEI